MLMGISQTILNTQKKDSNKVIIQPNVIQLSYVQLNMSLPFLRRGSEVLSEIASFPWYLVA